MRIAVVHGPNLNLLGTREPSVYGNRDLGSIDAELAAEGLAHGVEVESYQSNHEGELIDFIQQAASRVDGFVVNAGGYTHSSVALRDALAAVGRAYVEVHISNLHGREAFRRRSLLAAGAAGIVMGFGPGGYLLGLRGLISSLREQRGANPPLGRMV
jgi:3-dehydroquinate dehydratase II